MSTASQGFPRKLVKCGLAIQTALGAAATGPTTVFPLPAEDSIKYDPGFETVKWGDGTAYEHLVLQKLEKLTGGLTVPLIPGACTDLADWCTTEDDNYQGQWATLFFDFFDVLTVAYADVKVGSADLKITGAAGPELALTLLGLRKIAGVSLATSYAVETVPYKPSEQAVQMKLTGGSYATVVNGMNFSLKINRSVESHAQGAAVMAQSYAQFLSNTDALAATGTLDRRFTDSLLWDDFVAGTLGAIKYTVTRAAQSETIELPSILYTGDAPHGGPGGAVVEQKGVPFTALASSTHFVTAPISWTSVA